MVAVPGGDAGHDDDDHRVPQADQQPRPGAVRAATAAIRELPVMDRLDRHRVRRTAAGAGGVAARRPVPAAGRGPPGGRLRRLGGLLLDGLAPLRDARVVLAALALACATRATDVAAAWPLCTSLGLPSGLAVAILALLLVGVSNVLPTAPAQVGSFDAAVATALRALGASDTVSLAYAVQLHAQQLLPQIVAGPVPLLGAGTARRHKAPARTESPR
jgi:uncharacterized membrane protein YbhN (UPF0104 family)